MIAWLITMTPGSTEEVITVLNYRLSSRTVGAIMERMYIEKREGLSSLVEYAKIGKANCPWKQSVFDSIPYDEKLWCGSGDRYFWARKVDNLEITTDKDGHEKLTWTERKRPDFTAVRKALGDNGSG